MQCSKCLQEIFSYHDQPPISTIQQSKRFMQTVKDMMRKTLEDGKEQRTISCFYSNAVTCHGPLTRYAKLQVAHVPGMRGTFSPPPQFGDADMHHGTCVTHVPWGSLTSVFLRSRWRGKCSWHSRSMHNPQFYISGKRPILEHAIKRYIILTCTASHEQASETQVTYYQQPAESRSA